MRPHDCGDAAVQPARERDLLAGRLGVHVDEDERGLPNGGIDEPVDDLEHRGRGMEKERSEHVDDRESGSVRRRNDREPAARRRRRCVRGTHDALRALEVRTDLRPPEGVVPQRDRIHAHSEELVGEARGDSDAVRGVFAVHDADVDCELFPHPGKERFQRTSARCAHDVGDEEDAQGGETKG